MYMFGAGVSVVCGVAAGANVSLVYTVRSFCE